MYACTVFPFVSFTLATLRRAEFGFLGFATKMDEMTPFFCGWLSSSGDVGRFGRLRCLRRTAWLSVTSEGGVLWNSRADDVDAKGVEVRVSGWARNGGNGARRARRVGDAAVCSGESAQGCDTRANALSEEKSPAIVDGGEQDEADGGHGRGVGREHTPCPALN